MQANGYLARATSSRARQRAVRAARYRPRHTPQVGPKVVDGTRVLEEKRSIESGPARLPNTATSLSSWAGDYLMLLQRARIQVQRPLLEPGSSCEPGVVP
jgi:hypothetical protein